MQLDTNTLDRAWLRTLSNDDLERVLIDRMSVAEEHGVDPLLHEPFLRCAEEGRRREEASP